MRGTEKQIAWAEDIIKTVSDIMDRVFVEIPAPNKNTFAQAKEIYSNVLDNLRNAYAGDVIEYFKDLRNCEDIKSAGNYLNICINVAEDCGMVLRKKKEV